MSEIITQQKIIFLNKIDITLMNSWKKLRSRIMILWFWVQKYLFCSYLWWNRWNMEYQQMNLIWYDVYIHRALFRFQTNRNYEDLCVSRPQIIAVTIIIIIVTMYLCILHQTQLQLVLSSIRSSQIIQVQSTEASARPGKEFPDPRWPDCITGNDSVYMMDVKFLSWFQTGFWPIRFHI